MKMAGADQVHEGKALKNSEEADSCNPHQWMTMKHGNDISNSASISSSGDPTSSDMSSDVMDDATSSSSSPSYGPLYELSELMAQLPIKRGLSKYYQGKSQTFASLGCVKSLEDLAKKGRPCRRKMKACKSYGGGLDNRIHSPKATISKKSSRVSFL